MSYCNCNWNTHEWSIVSRWTQELRSSFGRLGVMHIDVPQARMKSLSQWTMTWSTDFLIHLIRRIWSENFSAKHKSRFDFLYFQGNRDLSKSFISLFLYWNVLVENVEQSIHRMSKQDTWFYCKTVVGHQVRICSFLKAMAGLNPSAMV